MQALILAGERGMPLSPLTDDAPKSLLYLPGGTILDYLLHHIAALSIEKTALVLQYRGDEIARYVAEQRNELQLIPQRGPFTLLSALASAAHWVEEPTLVLHGDYYFSHHLRYFLQKADPTRPTFLLPSKKSRMNAFAKTGAYILPPAAFHAAAQMVNENNLFAFYAGLIQRGMRPMTIPLQGSAYHIKTPTDLLTVNRHLLTQWHEAMHPPEAARGYDALNFNWIAPDAEVDKNFNGLFVTIGPKASIQQSYLYNSLLMPGVTLNGASKKNAVLASKGSRLMQIHTSYSQQRVAA